jgi:hypothetical protein
MASITPPMFWFSGITSKIKLANEKRIASAFDKMSFRFSGMLNSSFTPNLVILKKNVSIRRKFITVTIDR